MHTVPWGPDLSPEPWQPIRRFTKFRQGGMGPETGDDHTGWHEKTAYAFHIAIWVMLLTGQCDNGK